ncbi:longevity assurance proteins LAG1/LAC1 [Clavulina sp. PMI_390]|nr:longevity assurance proteins LAG1/LAC1 [Clavulina sp. PMI_390]
MRWLTVPASSFKLLAAVLVLWANWEVVTPLIAAYTPYGGGTLTNPFNPLIFISYLLPDSTAEDPRYGKGPLDLLFIGYYIIIWSFVRQSLVLHVFHPLGRYFRLKKSKFDRFGEQGYAIVYFGFFGSLGLYVMTQQPTWFYQTSQFWLDYPHWRMTPLMKRYYLMQLSYWIQQLIIMVSGLEKPRKDFRELVIHHLVTIWLVGWSYTVNLTRIGNAIFITMDVSDAFFANAKLLNYLDLDLTSTIAFAIFIPIWTYLRHYLNIRILISVWNEFELIPMEARGFEPLKGIWMVWWMKYQIFVPILLLQIVNLCASFWYFLIWRVLFRILWTGVVADERSDDEGEEDDEKVEAKKHR